MALAPDSILQNRYRIVRKLGEGGMGSVYLAIDQRFDSELAIKESHFSDEASRRQFEREARLLNRLKHPAMTRVIDHFTEGDGQFLVMDYVEGEDLWEMLQKRGEAFPPEKVLEWGGQLLDALCYLHKQDPPIIHRDIKPHNLKLSDTGQIILLDFGLAKGTLGQSTSIMASRSVFGYTPVYAPLEQIHGVGTDPRSDIYSLGATIYHLITGVIPTDAPTRFNAIEEDRADPLRPANQVSVVVAAEIAEVIKKAMAVNRRDRFATAAEMGEALAGANKVQSSASELEQTVLPPNILDPALTKVAQIEAKPLAPTVAKSDSVHKPRSTIAAATVASSTGLAVSSAKSAPFMGTAPLLGMFEQPAQRSKRLPLIVGAAIALLVIGIAAIVIYRSYSTGNQSQNRSNVISGGEFDVNSIKPDPTLTRLLPQSIQKSAELRIGTDATYPPFESNEGGQFTGFDIDLGNAIARRLGVKATFINTAFDGIFPALQNGSFDMVMSGVTITRERSASMLFSDPYFDYGQIIVVRKDTEGMESPESLKNRSVGVQINTTAQFELENRLNSDSLIQREISKFNTIDLAMIALRNKQIDAVVSDEPIARYMIRKSFPELKLAGRRFTDEKFGIAISQANVDLQKAVNAALKQIKDSGDYNKIYEKWFGIPATITGACPTCSISSQRVG